MGSNILLLRQKLCLGPLISLIRTPDIFLESPEFLSRAPFFFMDPLKLSHGPPESLTGTNEAISRPPEALWDTATPTETKRSPNSAKLKYSLPLLDPQSPWDPL